MDNSAPKLPAKSDVAAVIASAMIPTLVLLWGMQPDNAYSYYVFLRMVVFAGALVFTAIFAGYKREFLVILFVGIAILYNPFIPVHLTRENWVGFNLGTIVTFLVGLVLWLGIVRKARNAA